MKIIIGSASGEVLGACSRSFKIFFVIPSALQDASASEQKFESISAEAGILSPISAQSWRPNWQALSLFRNR